MRELFEKITHKELFAYKFRFSHRDLLKCLLEYLEIDILDFETNYFYFNSSRKLHISESKFGYVWISTYGLIATSKATNDRAVNAFKNQYTVISLLFDKAIETSLSDGIYDVDSYNFSQLSILTPTIFHNVIFYIEVFYKAYLSITGVEASHTHKLALLYQKTFETMIQREHNDTLFQLIILEPLHKFVDHIASIPGDFKEHFVKYDDNLFDDTVIIFEPEELIKMKNVLEASYDFISDYFYNGSESHYLETGAYNKILGKAKTDEDKKRVKTMYGHLVGNLG